PASPEPANVPLHLDGVLGEPALDTVAGGHLLGEHPGVARRGTVHRGRRLQDELGHIRRRLTGREELHRSDHVELLRGAAAADTSLRGGDVRVDGGVDVLDGQYLGDDGRAYVRADELDAAQVVVRRIHVQADDLVDLR